MEITKDVLNEIAKEVYNEIEKESDDDSQIAMAVVDVTLNVMTKYIEKLIRL